MADTDYKTLKSRIEELIENIGKVDQEAASFAATKADLVEIAGNLHAISSDLSTAIKTAGVVLSEVETVAVSSTLEMLKNSAARFDESGNQLLIEFKEKSADLVADLKKKMYIVGGIAIACSIAALICAFV